MIPQKNLPTNDNEWFTPLTQQDIQIRQSPSYLASPPKEDILTKKINTELPKHEFWQGRLSSPIITIGSLAVFLCSTASFVYSKVVPRIVQSIDFEAMVNHFEKQVKLSAYRKKEYIRYLQQKQELGINKPKTQILLDRKKFDSFERLKPVAHQSFKVGYPITPIIQQNSYNQAKIIQLYQQRHTLLIKE